MISQRKLSANRANALKSRGPRTSIGKARASRNALRHGLAATVHRDPMLVDKVKNIAEAICGIAVDPQLFEQASIIAENVLVLQMVRREKLAVIERLRDPEAIALAKRDNSFGRAMARHGKLKNDIAELNSIEAGLAKLSKGQLLNQLDAIDEKFSREQATASPGEQIDERDEFASIREALPDLEKRTRYQRRALSRQKRAVREFIRIKSARNASNPE